MQKVAKPSSLSVLTLATVLFTASLASLAPNAPPSPTPEFLKYWKSGLAELSSYDLITERYGELRKGQGVLVFVYEEINADTRIKVETDKTPPAKMVPVLKLNNILKFTTGIYDYSIMTSVFAGLSGAGVGRFLEPRKVSFSSQEWCGNVFHQLLPRKEGLVSEIHSYFEVEGDNVVTLPYPKGTFYFQDEMPILIRELDGAFMSNGESRRINLVPGLWERRKRHIPLAFTEAVLRKVGKETFQSGQTTCDALKWTLETGADSTTYHVESAMPHKLLAWENNHGEKAVLAASVRNTYWEHHRNQDEPLRKELKLDYGVGSGNSAAARSR